MNTKWIEEYTPSHLGILIEEYLSQNLKNRTGSQEMFVSLIPEKIPATAAHF
ncbi:MAG: hypothetical protein ACLRYY_10190 [Anaerobutyricum soehngenii]